MNLIHHDRWNEFLDCLKETLRKRKNSGVVNCKIPKLERRLDLQTGRPQYDVGDHVSHTNPDGSSALVQVFEVDVQLADPDEVQKLVDEFICPQCRNLRDGDLVPKS